MLRFQKLASVAALAPLLAVLPAFSYSQSQPQPQAQTPSPAQPADPQPATAPAPAKPQASPLKQQPPASGQQTAPQLGSQPAPQPAPVKAPAPAPQAQAAPLQNAKPAKVWTNDEIDTLRRGPSVSVVGRNASQNVSATSSKKLPPEKDPAWYRNQLQPLMAEIEKLDAQIDKLQKFLSGEHVSDPPTMSRQMVPTPQEQLKQLEDKRAKDVEKVNDLLDRARHNDIAPGDLR